MCLAIPGCIVEIDRQQPKLAIVDVAGVRRTVNISCVIDEAHPPEACVGEWVLVHVGFAMNRINPDEAKRTLDLLNELGEVQAIKASGDT